MKEILRNQPARFKNYAELTIMKTLEAHKDSHKEVGEQARAGWGGSWGGVGRAGWVVGRHWVVGGAGRSG